MSVYMRDPQTGRTCKRGQKGAWYYDFTIKGSRYREAIPEARTKQQALLAEAKARSAVFDGTYGKRAGQADFVTFANGDYLMWAKEKKRSDRVESCYLSIVCDFFKGKKFADITPNMIAKYRDERLTTKTFSGKPRNPNSVARELAMISKIFSLAIKRGYCEKNPCSKIERPSVPNRRNRMVSDEEEKLILDQLTGRYARLRPVFILAINTGMRRGEMFSLQWSDLDFETGVIKLREKTTKNLKARVIPIIAPVREALLELLPEEKPEHGRKIFEISKNRATITFKELCASIGLNDVTLHTLRHTFVSRLAECGVHPYIAKDITGHAQLKMTEYYTHAAPEIAKDAMKRLENRPVSLNSASETK